MPRTVLSSVSLSKVTKIVLALAAIGLKRVQNLLRRFLMSLSDNSLRSLTLFHESFVDKELRIVTNVTTVRINSYFYARCPATLDDILAPTRRSKLDIDDSTLALRATPSWTLTHLYFHSECRKISSRLWSATVPWRKGDTVLLTKRSSILCTNKDHIFQHSLLQSSRISLNHYSFVPVERQCIPKILPLGD